MNTALKTTFFFSDIFHRTHNSHYFFLDNANSGRPSSHNPYVCSKPLTGGGLMSLFSTHPLMEERIVKLELLAGQ